MYAQPESPSKVWPWEGVVCGLHSTQAEDRPQRALQAQAQGGGTGSSAQCEDTATEVGRGRRRKGGALSQEGQGSPWVFL